MLLDWFDGWVDELGFTTEDPSDDWFARVGSGVIFLCVIQPLFCLVFFAQLMWLLVTDEGGA